MSAAYRYCPVCATPLATIELLEDGGPKSRLRCPACAWTHWNNPTPVLSAVIECTDRDGRLLLARNAAWPAGMFGLVAGYLEAGETPTDGIRREIAEETALAVGSLELIGVWDFQRMNQVIVAYHARCSGEIKLSAELAEYRLIELAKVRCWHAGTGLALAAFVRSRGLEPHWLEPRG